LTTIAIQADREGEHASLVLTGSFDLEHAIAVDRAVRDAEEQVSGCRSVDVDLSGIERMDGSGALLLARLLARLNASDCRTHVVERQNPDAARLIALYCERQTTPSPPQTGLLGPLARLGALVTELPAKARDALDFTGRCVISLPKAVAAPNSVDWRSLPRLCQEIGADALPVTSAANLLVGVIIGLLGVSQLGRFGAIAYVPELVVVAHFRELGPLVTAIVVAGRSGAGIASEIATMKVSEEIDALQSLGFDPVRWLVVPRCLALVATVPLLTWVGDALVIVGGLVATIVTTHMTPRAYLQATLVAITADQLLVGLVKSPFLALAIGLIACGQGLLARGGASAVGARTTTAVVMAILSVIVVSAVFTFFFALLGV
jgi:phospholipid/cholesterol/gamma-HCH transport system permease protein